MLSRVKMYFRGIFFAVLLTIVLCANGTEAALSTVDQNILLGVIQYVLIKINFDIEW